MVDDVGSEMTEEQLEAERLEKARAFFQAEQKMLEEEEREAAKSKQMREET